MSDFAAMGFRYVTKSSTDQRQVGETRALNAPKLVRHKTIGPGGDIWSAVRKRPTSLPITSTKARPRSDKDRPKTTSDKVQTTGKEGKNQRVPVLGPTRQQTKIYLRNNRKKHR